MAVMKSQSCVIFFVCVLLCTVGAIVPAKSIDSPSQNLKDIKIVSYQGVAEPDKGRCAIDMNSWNTAIDFVANSINGLKLIRWHDHLEQQKLLLDEVKKAGKNLASDPTDDKAQKELNEARERWRKFFYAPKLLFSIQTMDITIGCAGAVSAEVSVQLGELVKIIVTDLPAYQPHMTIWEAGSMLQGPYTTFSSDVIGASEQVLKSFVNDWTKSQELPP